MPTMNDVILKFRKSKFVAYSGSVTSYNTRTKTRWAYSLQLLRPHRDYIYRANV